MQTVLIVIHLMVVVALVGVVLLQRSEGGGLGIGGGSGFMTARGAANALTRATGILAIAFFATSLGLSLLARYGERPIDILDRAPVSGEQNGGAAGNGSGSGGVLDKLGGNNKATPPAENGGTTSPSGESKPATPPPAPAPASPAVPNSQ
ncbi:preprotein translocase subunit SecG [Mesorhizobium sp. BAC0120]|uniref:preprotein translocase subunit SecG n=1 Tax=Mesorhizobium sp. BAC0120 TaxID=3090670 RepID=UPI00298BE30D|nr:preprotein translocase subunit SecG [Mesorhizobium sp. BAC0120]MDW6022837.1 preprotein translocase subunit SecG [Mesorhizobium sp. BAC0120]